MSAADWFALAASTTATLGGLFYGLRFLVRSFLKELLPNGGSSLADRVNRIEQRVDSIYEHLLGGK